MDHTAGELLYWRRLLHHRSLMQTHAVYRQPSCPIINHGQSTPLRPVWAVSLFHAQHPLTPGSLAVWSCSGFGVLTRTFHGLIPSHGKVPLAPAFLLVSTPCLTSPRSATELFLSLLIPVFLLRPVQIGVWLCKITLIIIPAV